MGTSNFYESFRHNTSMRVCGNVKFLWEFPPQHFYESLWERQISMRVSATTLLWEFVGTSNFYESFRHNTSMRVCGNGDFYESFRHNTSKSLWERQISMRVSATTLLWEFVAGIGFAKVWSLHRKLCIFYRSWTGTRQPFHQAAQIWTEQAQSN